MRNLQGKKAKIVGEIVEHLTLGSKEWVTILLPNNQKITINVKYCDEILESKV